MKSMTRMTTNTTMLIRRVGLASMHASLLCLGLLMLPSAQAKTVVVQNQDLPVSSREENADASPRWKAVRKSIWGTRAIQEATPDQLQINAPKRAGDPAVVPLAVVSNLPKGLSGSIKRITLVIDNNPSPIAAILDFPDTGAQPGFETRARIDEYSYVRAIAETKDGKLLMATRFVKASGGCAAPPGGDVAAMEASMGRMLFRVDPPTAAGQPTMVQWTVSHPNHSGMAMDQYTRQFTPAHYVRSVTLSQGNRVLLVADVDFALSENPSLRFQFVPQGDAPLRAEVVDTRDKKFSGSADVKDVR
jgi:sulfur-oxidizing protein SoxY